MKKIFIIISILTIGSVFAVKFFMHGEPSADAGSATTSVQIQNVVPVFTVAPAEATASYATVPTNVGGTITFQATATDANNDQWKILVCKTNGATGTACTGGAGSTWCTGSLVASGSQSSCNYTTAASDGWTNDWYAFACDSTGCSASAQGSGNSGSPFFTNHVPAFTAISNNSGKNPGETVTWTATASDPDTGSTVKLFVCKTAAFTGTACSGGEWCQSTAVASNPTCGYGVPTPTQDRSYDAYVYVVDNFNLAATSDKQGSASNMVVNNVAPTVTASSIQLLNTTESGNLTLTSAAAETTGFKLKFTVVDNNSCINASSTAEVVSAAINVFRSGVGSSSCSATGDHHTDKCYVSANAAWNPSCTQDAGTCSGATDSSTTWTCTFPLSYNADPTVLSSQYPSENWLATVRVTDDNAAASSLTQATSGNEVDLFLSYQVTTASISYGALVPGADSSEANTVLVARGNVGVDQDLSGTNMTSGSDTIAVGQQKYNLTATQGWASGTALTTSPANVALNVAKPKVGALTPSKSTYWVLRVPAAQASGSYSGTNTISGKTSSSSNW